MLTCWVTGRVATPRKSLDFTLVVIICQKGMIKPLLKWNLISRKATFWVVWAPMLSFFGWPLPQNWYIFIPFLQVHITKQSLAEHLKHFGQNRVQQQTNRGIIPYMQLQQNKPQVLVPSLVLEHRKITCTIIMNKMTPKSSITCNNRPY